MSELHSLSALRQAADHLRAEERHWWADAIMAAIETLTRDDDSAAAIESVREMHTPGAEGCSFHDSAFCYCAGVYCEACGDSYPCPTIQALDGSVDPAPVDPVLDGLNNTVVAELNTHWQHRAADAWDEGFTAGVNADMGDHEHPDDGSWHTNPYRKEANHG